MFSLTYNFDILKYIINNLIKNQQKLNYKLIELKIDKVNNEKKIDELESDLMDLQQEKNGSKNDKKNKNKKNYKDIIKQLTKEKDNYFQLLKNSNQENIILNGRTQKLEEEIKQDKELTAKMNEDLQEDINEIYKRMDELKEEIEVKVNDNIKKLDSKIEDIDKNISLINNDLKTQDDKINKKLSEEISKLFGSLFTEKTNEINSSIDNLDKSIKQNNNNFESFKKLANEKFELLEQKFQDDLQDNQKVFKEIFKQTSQIEKRLDDFVELKTYNPKIKEIENKILNNYRELSNEIMQVSQIAEKNETAISDMKNDKTNKNNIILLSNKIDNLNDEISKLNDEVILFDSDRKKLDEINPNDYVYKNDFEDFIESNKKTIENLKKYTYEIRSMIDDIKISYSKGRVTLKDLKNLEDKIISKMMEFGEEINEKFAEKKFVLKLIKN
jgi:chromosome segregation ATPase